MRREPVLRDTDSVIAGNLYVANVGPGGIFRPISSIVTGTVAMLKIALAATVVKAIDLPSRRGELFDDELSLPTPPPPFGALSFNLAANLGLIVIAFAA